MRSDISFKATDGLTLKGGLCLTGVASQASGASRLRALRPLPEPVRGLQRRGRRMVQAPPLIKPTAFEGNTYVRCKMARNP
jgi:hypothetical protein